MKAVELVPTLHIYNSDGTCQTYHPANGEKWTLAELQFLTGDESRCVRDTPESRDE